MSAVTWIRVGQMGQPMVTELRPAGRTVRGLEIAADAEFAQLVGGSR